MERDHIADLEPWVVTYRVVHTGGLSIVEMFRGSEAECKRIASHSVSPASYEGKRVLEFSPIIGPASKWDEFLADQ